MGNFKLTTVEEFEAATERLLETGKRSADAWQLRVKTRHRIVNLVSRVSVAESVLWDPVVSPRRHRKESAVAMCMAS